MNYLKEYNITDEEIEFFKTHIEDSYVKDTIIYEQDKIRAILDIFKNIGVTNFFDLISVGNKMFLNKVSSIKLYVDSYPDKDELARQLNEDARFLFEADII